MHKRQVEMTDLWVRNVRTVCVREEWRDVRELNLELRVTANGAKTWRLHYTRSDGRRKAMKLGRYSADGSNASCLLAHRALPRFGSGDRYKPRAALATSVFCGFEKAVTEPALALR
jgi:Arm DNA-binding domain